MSVKRCETGPGETPRGLAAETAALRKNLSAQADVSPLGLPGAAEGIESFGAEDLLGHREDDAFFFIEMFARCQHNTQEKTSSGFKLPGGLNDEEVFLNFSVFLMEGLALADLLETMFERTDKELIFGVGMGFEDFLDHCGHALDLSQRFHVWGRSLDVIEHVVKHEVFGQ